MRWHLVVTFWSMREVVEYVSACYSKSYILQFFLPSYRFSLVRWCGVSSNLTEIQFPFGPQDGYKFSTQSYLTALKIYFMCECCNFSLLHFSHFGFRLEKHFYGTTIFYVPFFIFSCLFLLYGMLSHLSLANRLTDQLGWIALWLFLFWGISLVRLPCFLSRIMDFLWEKECQANSHK